MRIFDASPAAYASSASCRAQHGAVGATVARCVCLVVLAAARARFFGGGGGEGGRHLRSMVSARRAARPGKEGVERGRAVSMMLMWVGACTGSPSSAGLQTCPWRPTISYPLGSRFAVEPNRLSRYPLSALDCGCGLALRGRYRRGRGRCGLPLVTTAGIITSSILP